ncbi:MAG TPA: carbohydrate kinase family protein [Candidatus Paceibacterota bacterium]|nr:carbohydrate kinase family protein [Candidatus Paceibacterota bacterium]
MKNYDFIGIGDIVTDAFIKLKEAEVKDGSDGNKKICMNFGDKIPYEDVFVVPAVGNSINASVSAARLGLKSALITNLGKDYQGKECLDVLKKEKVDTKFVRAHKGKKTNYHYVLLFGAERTILIKHEDFPYVLPDIGEPRWLYLSSLGANSLNFHSEIEKYLNEHSNIKLAFQPGTYQMKFGAKALAGIYKRTDIFTCNKEEAQRVLETDEKDIKNLLLGIHNLGPKIVAITDGKDGAYLYNEGKYWFIPIYPDPKPPINRTGAGDAFSSTFVIAIMLGKSPEEALRWGPINSMSVTQQIGARAGLLSREKLEEFLKDAPEDYKPKEI